MHRVLPPIRHYICNTWRPADSSLIFLASPLPTIICSIPSIWKLSSGWCCTTTLISAFNAKSSHTFNCLYHNSHPRWCVEFGFTHDGNPCFASYRLWRQDIHDRPESLGHPGMAGNNKWGHRHKTSKGTYGREDCHLPNYLLPSVRYQPC